MASLSLTQPPGLRSYELGIDEAKKNILSSSLEILVPFCPASRAGPLGEGHLPVSILGSSELKTSVLKKTSQKRPHSGPWQKRLCDGPDSDGSCPVSRADPGTSLPDPRFSEPG